MKKFILSLFFLNSLVFSSDVSILKQNPWNDLLDIITNPDKQNIGQIEDYIKMVNTENIPDSVKAAFLTVAQKQKDQDIGNLRNKICFNTVSWTLFFTSLSSAKYITLKTWNSILQINKLIPYTLTALAFASFVQYCNDIAAAGVPIKQYGLHAVSAYFMFKMLVNVIKFSSPEETLFAKKLTKSSHILYVLKKYFKPKLA